jgi:hypothetical protein
MAAQQTERNWDKREICAMLSHLIVEFPSASRSLYDTQAMLSAFCIVQNPFDWLQAS